MQKELATTYPALRIELLGVNALGQEAGNGPTTEGRELPWLQDVDANKDGRSDAGTLWNVSYRDVYILDGGNVQVAAFDVESKDLEQPANYAALRELLIDAAMTSQKPWRNADQPLDVNDDGNIEPLDALIIINKLNTEGPHKLPPPKAGDPPLRYYDCNGNGEVAPVDALNVINHLNGQNAAAGAEGEGLAGLAPTPPAAGQDAFGQAAGNDLRKADASLNDAGSSRHGATGLLSSDAPLPTAARTGAVASAAPAEPPASHPLEQLDWWLTVRVADESLLDALGWEVAME